jgi:hypothetical protein
MKPEIDWRRESARSLSEKKKEGEPVAKWFFCFMITATRRWAKRGPFSVGTAAAATGKEKKKKFKSKGKNEMASLLLSFTSFLFYNSLFLLSSFSLRGCVFLFLLYFSNLRKKKKKEKLYTSQ